MNFVAFLAMHGQRGVATQRAGSTRCTCPPSQAGFTPHTRVNDWRAQAVLVSPSTVARVVPTDPDADPVPVATLTGVADLMAWGDSAIGCHG